MFDKETKNCIIKSEAAEMPLCQDHRVGKFPALFAMATSQSPGWTSPWRPLTIPECVF